MKNLIIELNPKEKFSASTVDLMKKQIDNSLKLGWKEKDIICLSTKTSVADAIFHLLNQEIVKEGEIWWYHDLNVFQLKPMDSSNIDLEDTTAGFTEDSTGKINIGNFFFRKLADKIFEWTRNRSRQFGGNESAALNSLVKENFHNINAKYIKLDGKKMAGLFKGL